MRIQTAYILKQCLLYVLFGVSLQFSDNYCLAQESNEPHEALDKIVNLAQPLSLNCKELFYPSPLKSPKNIVQKVKDIKKEDILNLSFLPIPPIMRPVNSFEAFFPLQNSIQNLRWYEKWIYKSTQGIPLFISKKISANAREFRPFNGIKNLLLDKPIYFISSKFGSPRIAGPILTLPYSFITGAISFGIAMAPVYFSIDKAGHYYHQVELNHNSTYYENLINTDFRFTDIKIHRKVLESAALNDLTSSLGGPEQKEKVKDIQEQLKSFKLLSHEQTSQKAIWYRNLYELYFISGFSETIIDQGYNLIPSILLSPGLSFIDGYDIPTSVQGPVPDYKLKHISKLQIELALKLEAASILIVPEQSLLKEMPKTKNKMNSLILLLSQDEYYLKLKNLYLTKKITQSEFLMSFQDDLNWRSIFEMNKILGIRKLKPIPHQEGEAPSWTNENLKLSDVRVH